MDERPMEGTEEDALYRRLWLSVIERAKLDADGKDLMLDGEEGVEGVMRDAREWLTEDGEDLELVCEMSGINFERLIGYMRRGYGR